MVDGVSKARVVPIDRDMNEVKCPRCGESYYMVNYSTRTAMYYPPIYKDGVNVNPDGNIETTVCTCLNCHYEFEYQTRYGELWNGYDN